MPQNARACQQKDGSICHSEISDAQDSAAKLDTAAHAAYIRDMVFELRSMAERRELVVLAYFLDMAFEEASNQARR